MSASAIYRRQFEMFVRDRCDDIQKDGANSR